MSFLDDMEAKASTDERPAFLDKKPKRSFLDDLEEKAAAGAPKPDRIGAANAAFDEAKAGVAADRATVAHDQAANAGPGAAFMNEVANTTRFGFGDELEGAAARARDLLAGRKGPTYQQYRDELRDVDATHRGAHPYASMAGGLVGALAAPGGSAGAGATRAGTALVAGTQGALAGAGNSTEDTALGVARDAAVSGGLSAGLSYGVGSLVRRAPERVDESIVKGITKGDDTNAGMRISRKVSERIGEEGEDLLGMLDQNAPLKRVLATKAASSPRVAEKAIQKRLDHLTPQTDKVYAAIDDVTGGVDLRDVTRSLAENAKVMRAAGKTAYANAMDAAAEDLAKNYGDKIIPARTLRNYANQVGDSAFASVDPKLRARAGQQVYKVIVGGIEDAGHVAGVDVQPLRKLNHEISTLIPIKQAFKARAEQEQLGRKSLSETIKHAVIPVAGALLGAGHGHSIEGLAAGAAGYGAVKAAKPLARAANWQMAKLALAARNGSTPAQLGQLAIEMGLSAAAGEEIAKRISAPAESQSQ